MLTHNTTAYLERQVAYDEPALALANVEWNHLVVCSYTDSAALHNVRVQLLHDFDGGLARFKLHNSHGPSLTTAWVSTALQETRKAMHTSGHGAETGNFTDLTVAILRMLVEPRCEPGGACRSERRSPGDAPLAEPVWREPVREAPHCDAA